ncbi:asparagine synthetase A [Caldisericum sp. AR60]|uniref:asparagine synthetase A n=1 Tax=Caldisericum sp. AR60 TaxID=3397852 RepID=UPI0039FD05D5
MNFEEESMKKETLEVQSEAIFRMGEFLRSRGFVEILPVIISPLTDPLNHSLYDARIPYGGGYYSLTKSMIFHKQLALREYPKIFIFSPNVRLEREDKKDSRRHLIEFVQLDLEIKDATREDILDLVEDLIIYTMKKLEEKFGDFIKATNPKFHIPKKPFERIKFLEAKEKYGNDFEMILSRERNDPFFLIDIPIEEREFYDRLSDDGKTLIDMDLIYPYGFGEGMSGGEREYEYERIIKRMKFKNMNLQDWDWYLKEVKKGLPRSAGCGIGIERFTRFTLGLESIKEARLFAKLPGEIAL